MKKLDQLERRFVDLGIDFFVMVLVAVSFLDHDTAFDQQTFQHIFYIQFRVLVIAHAQRDSNKFTKYE